jgi:CubicO group peptidase (beta-lactamase class C family)
MSTAWFTAHGIPEADYQSRFDTLPPGYRPRWVQAYGTGAGPRFCGVWVQDASWPCVARHRIEAADYQAHFKEYADAGWRLRCVSAYLDLDRLRYATIWDQEPSPPWESHHEISFAQYQDFFRSMLAKGLRLVHVNACGIGRDSLFTTIWEQRGGAWESHHDLDDDAFRAEFLRLNGLGFRLRQVCTYVVDGRPRHIGLWDGEADVPWQARHARPRDLYQWDFEDLRLGGYRPTCVTGAEMAFGERFSGVFDNVELPATSLQTIESEATTFMRRFSVPGLSLAFTQQGRLVYAQAFGTADVAGNEPLRTRHRMRIASVSKPITSVAVHRFVQQGAATLNDAVFGAGARLGTTYGTKPYGTNLLAIRLHHLLEHTSGAWDNAAAGATDDLDGMDDPMFRFPGQGHAQLITSVLDTYPVDPPGTRWAYSNFGYCLLGRILEVLGAGGYAAVVQREVLTPAGISDMLIAGNTWAQRQNWEVEYLGQGGEDPYALDVARMDAHGGWMATAVDLVRFAVHVDGIGGKPPLLTPAARTAMLTATALETGYAHGWAVNAEPNRWHRGSLPGTRSMLVTAANGMSWSVLCNSRAPGGTADENMGNELDAMMWRIVNGVPAWPSYDLF